MAPATTARTSLATSRIAWSTSFIATFKVPSCKVDFDRNHTHPCLQFHIHRCLGPCVEGLTTEEQYARAVRKVRMFLEGRLKDLADDLRARMQAAAEEMRFEEAAGLRDLISTVEEMEQKQKIAAAEGDNTDIFAYYAEPPLVAANLFHLRNGHIVDRREFFWEDQFDFDPPEFFSSLLKQIYLDQQYIPSEIHVPVDFEDREVLEEFLSEKRGRKVEIHTPQRGQKKAMLGLVETNAKHSFHAALPRPEAVLEGYPGGVAGCARLCPMRPSASSASTSRTSRAPIKSPAWWCGKTAR